MAWRIDGGCTIGARLVPLIRRRSPAPALAVVLLAVLLAGCSSGSGSGAGSGADVGRAVAAASGGGRAARSTPFRPGPVPVGYVAVVAGEGGMVQAWHDDMVGTDAPFTVLAPGGDAADPRAVVVSLTAYGARGGSLDELLPGDAEELEVGGRDARWWPGDPGAEVREGDGPALLRVALDDEAALEVSGMGGTRAAFEAIVAATVVDPADHGRAPVVVDPPDGLALAGSVDADGVIALQAFLQGDQLTPGLPGTHTVGWARDDGVQGDLVVLDLPAGSVDPTALLTDLDPGRADGTTATPIEVGGAPGVLLDRAHVGEPLVEARRAVIGRTSWGETVVVVARGIEEVPSTEALVALAEGLRPATDEQWEEQAEAIRTAHRATPEPGYHEVVGGEVDGHRWFLQAHDHLPTGAADPTAELLELWAVDPCVRFATGERTCAYGGGPAEGTYWSGVEVAAITGRSGTPSWAPAVVIVLTRLPGTAARFTDGGGTTTDVPLTVVPGTSIRVAVAFRSADRLACSDRPDDDGAIGLDIVDAAGTTLGCLPR